jgi:hypothetical protein
MQGPNLRRTPFFAGKSKSRTEPIAHERRGVRYDSRELSVRDEFGPEAAKRRGPRLRGEVDVNVVAAFGLYPLVVPPVYAEDHVALPCVEPRWGIRRQS